MRVILLLAAVAIATPAFAGPKCTDKPRSEWMTEAKLRAQIAPENFQIDIFKTTKGNCFEIYGKNKDGKRIEIYYDPVTGTMVRSNTL